MHSPNSNAVADDDNPSITNPLDFGEEEEHVKRELLINGYNKLAEPESGDQTFDDDQATTTGLRFYCGVCGVSYTRNHKLKEHVKNKHHRSQSSPQIKQNYLCGKVRGQFECQWCEKSYTRSSKLKNHVLRHHQEQKPNQFKGQSQRNENGVFSAAIRHENREEVVLSEDEPHAIDDDHIQVECPSEDNDEGTSFNEYTEPNSHAQYYSIDCSSTEDRFVCNLCDNRYSRSVSLREHMLQRHDVLVPALGRHPSNVNNNESQSNGIKRFACEECGNSYTRKHKLKEHTLNKHTSRDSTRKRRQQAHLINKQNAANNKQSVRSCVSGSSVICEHCGQSFSQLGYLNIHVKRKHINANRSMLLTISEPFVDSCGRKRRVYTCPECGDKYSRTNMLRRHFVSKHNIPFPFKNPKKEVKAEVKYHLCEECGSSFQRKYRLREHMLKTHRMTLE